MQIDLNKEDVDELVERFSDYKKFFESGDFSEDGKRMLVENQFCVVLMLKDEIKKLQREIKLLKTT